MEYFEEKVSFLKERKLLLTTKHKDQAQAKQNHKVKILTTNQTNMVRIEANLLYFPIASEKSNLRKDHQSN